MFRPMPDPIIHRNAATKGFRVLLLASFVSLPLGCGGDDPADPILDTLEITTTSLPDAVQNVSYSASLAATGGDSSYRWAVTGAMAFGSPPTGLSLATNGVITGVPAFVESQSFTVEVRSGDGQIAQQPLSITVNPPPL